MNIGDKIKIIKNRYEVLEVGMEGQIYKIDSKDSTYGIPFNNILYWFYEDEIEKVENKKMSKDWTGNKATTFVQLGASNHSDKERENNDYYATDPNTLLLLKQLEIDGIKLHNNIWECACGEGHLSKVLEEKGYKVWSTDLIDRGYGIGNTDFLKSVPNSWCGDILTNPPYKYAKKFVEHALEVTRIGCYTIMLLKIQFLEGKERYKLFQKYPPKYVYVNSSRQLCAMNGEFEKYNATALCYCWFIWQKGFTGEPIIRWIKGD